MNFLIVDPDPLTRKIIRDVLIGRAHLVGECSSGLEAIPIIRETRPEVLFSEVDLPGISGFHLLEMIAPDLRPTPIFMNRSDHHAARAFEASAVDYLLKPLDPERIHRAFERVHRHGRNLAAKNSHPVDSQNGRLAIRTGRSVLFLRKSELDWAEAEGKYVRLHIGRESVLLKMSISSLEAELDPAQFLRIHRSTLVNVDRVRWVQPWTSGRNYQVVLDDGTKLVLSRKDHLPVITGRAVLSV